MRRSLWERPAARCLSWRDIWCSHKWDGMWEGWRWKKGCCGKRADAMYLGENAVDLWGTRSTAHSSQPWVLLSNTPCSANRTRTL